MEPHDRLYIPIEDAFTSQRPVPNPMEELKASLERIIDHYPPTNDNDPTLMKPKCAGLYYGPISVSYLFYKLSTLPPTKDLAIQGGRMKDWGLKYLELSMACLGSGSGLSAFNRRICGVYSEKLCILAIRSAFLEDRDALKQLCLRKNLYLKEGEGEDEWLYGRAGYLYLLRLACPGYSSRGQEDSEEERELKKMVQDTINETVERILRSPRPWSFGGKSYHGAAHGTMGIITQIVLSSPYYAKIVEKPLRDLLKQQLESGNWDSSIRAEDEGEKDTLVQWCHGAPGFVTSLEMLQIFYKDLADEMDHSLIKAREVVWNRGLLTKDPCLCHGIAGNAMSFIDERFDERFQLFLSYMTTKEMMGRGVFEKSEGSERYGLWTGEAGRAWIWAVECCGKEMRAKFRLIGYTDV